MLLVLVRVIIGRHNCRKWDDMKDRIPENLVLSLYLWMFLMFSSCFSISFLYQVICQKSMTANCETLFIDKFTSV